MSGCLLYIKKTTVSSQTDQSEFQRWVVVLLMGGRGLGNTQKAIKRQQKDTRGVNQKQKVLHDLAFCQEKFPSTTAPHPCNNNDITTSPDSCTVEDLASSWGLFKPVQYS